MLTSRQIARASQLLGRLGYDSFGDRQPTSSRPYHPPQSEEQAVTVRLKLMNDDRTGELRYVRVDEQGKRLE